MCKKTTARNRTRTVLTLAAVAMAILVLTATSANARIILEEQFIYEAELLDGLDGGTGFDGPWVASKSHGRDYEVGITEFAEPKTLNADAGLSFSTLPVAGSALSRYGNAGRAAAHRLLSGASQAALTRDNTTIWFGQLFQGTPDNRNGMFVLGTQPFSHTPGYQLAAAGDGFGFTTGNINSDGTGGAGDGSINAIAFDNSTGATFVKGTYTPDPLTATILIVGKINWKPNGTPDELFLFNVTDLSTEPAESEAFASITMDFDQSAFNMLAMYDGTDSVTDEIRFGNAFANVMGVVETGSSSDPSPADGATEVPRDVVLNWTPGEFAAAVNGHTVYLSESFDDVNDGIGGITQSTASYAPAQRLEFGTTYYWRVDEIDAPPDSTVYPGEVWSFTTELFVYQIENVIATASSSNVDERAENTVNGSGVDPNDLHSTETTDMWRSSPDGDGPAWIEYEFDRVSKLHEMWVWNHNSSLEQIYGFGFKDVSVEYSVDGIDYKALGTTHEFAQAPGTPGYAHDTIDFEGAAAKYVRLTANSTWGSVLSGLSEVRFFRIPVHATEPYPDSGATDVDLDVVLGWKAGRDAVSHDVYISADPNALALAGPVTETAFDTASLDLELGQDYYWRIDEVNDAETTTTWQGDIWSFSTPEFLVVDDFESYNDIDPPDPESNTIFGSWSDGYLTPTTNGALVGYEPAQPPSQPSYMEHAIVYDGDQSMPFSYNNTIASYSEASVNTDDLAIGRDWTKGSPTTMLLRFYGDPNNALTEQLYVKIGDTRVDYPGDVAALAEPRWSEWPIDLTDMDLSNVTELAIGFDRLGGVGGQGTVMIDAVWLNAASTMVPVTVPDAGFDDHVLNNVGDIIYVGDSGYTGAWKSDYGSGGAYIDYRYWLGDGDLPARSGEFKAYPSDATAFDYIYQILDETFIEGATYTLSVWVGNAWPGQGYADGWGLYFTGEDYNINLIEAHGLALSSDWEQISLEYTATAADAGKKIGIKLSGEEGESYIAFDDVTLFHSVPVVTLQPTVWTEKASYSPNEPIVVHFTNAAGNSTD